MYKWKLWIYYSENMKSDLENEQINDEIRDELKELYEKIDENKLNNILICEYYEVFFEYYIIISQYQQNITKY